MYYDRQFKGAQHTPIKRLDAVLLEVQCGICQMVVKSPEQVALSYYDPPTWPPEQNS